MTQGQLEKRLPAIVLIGVLAFLSIFDWTVGLQAGWMVPAQVTGAWDNLAAGNLTTPGAGRLATTLTCALFHGDLSHLVGNALFLWLFGAVICEQFGWRWMVGTFVLTSIGGSVGQILLNPISTIPVLGASGGLMGLEGFYFGLVLQHPRPPAEVWPVSRPFHSTQLALAAAIGIFLDFAGIMDGHQGIAHGAHLGGFITGVFISFLGDRLIR